MKREETNKAEWTERCVERTTKWWTRKRGARTVGLRIERDQMRCFFLYC